MIHRNKYKVVLVWVERKTGLNKLRGNAIFMLNIFIFYPRAIKRAR